SLLRSADFDSPAGRRRRSRFGITQDRPRGRRFPASQDLASSVSATTSKEIQMIRSGDTIHNPVTGERITFLATSRDTNGEAVVIETVVQPHGFVAAAHVHPSQSERFAVDDGTLELKVGGERLFLEPGEIATVEPGTPHKFWNGGEDEVRFVCEIRPALQFE